VDEGSLCCSRCGTGFPIRNRIAHFVSAEELGGRNRQFARFYDWFSRFEALSYKVFSLPAGGERKVRGEVLDRLDRNAGRVLEVSVGSGGNLPYLFESPALDHVCGLDISAGQLARCRRAVARQGWPVDLFLAMAEKIPFKAESFDCVFHVGGINFFSEKKRAIYSARIAARRLICRCPSTWCPTQCTGFASTAYGGHTVSTTGTAWNSPSRHRVPAVSRPLEELVRISSCLSNEHVPV
jgi:hypothetical protein